MSLPSCGPCFVIAPKSQPCGVFNRRHRAYPDVRLDRPFARRVPPGTARHGQLLRADAPRRTATFGAPAPERPTF